MKDKEKQKAKHKRWWQKHGKEYSEKNRERLNENYRRAYQNPKVKTWVRKRDKTRGELKLRFKVQCPKCAGWIVFEWFPDQKGDVSVPSVATHYEA